MGRGALSEVLIFVTVARLSRNRQGGSRPDFQLETLWDQPQVDHGRIEKLSGEIAQIEAQLAKKRDKHLLECRKQFGDRGWTCPGSW